MDLQYCCHLDGWIACDLFWYIPKGKCEQPILFSWRCRIKMIRTSVFYFSFIFEQAKQNNWIIVSSRGEWLNVTGMWLQWVLNPWTHMCTMYHFPSSIAQMWYLWSMYIDTIRVSTWLLYMTKYYNFQSLSFFDERSISAVATMATVVFRGRLCMAQFNLFIRPICSDSSVTSWIIVVW